MKSRPALFIALGLALVPTATIFAEQNQQVQAEQNQQVQAEQSLLQSQSTIQVAKADEETEKLAIQNAMKDYVQQLTAKDGLMPILHEGKVLKLKLHASPKYPDGFHAGVSNHGDLYASCADFIDPETGNKYDIDFLVSKVEAGYKVVQPFVHSVNGIKNPYDLAH